MVRRMSLIWQGPCEYDSLTITLALVSQARLPAIASRPTPRRKHVSTAVPNSSSSSTAPDQMAHVHVKKAAKRAAKRENVLFSSRNSNTMTRSLATDDSGAQVSKSALRRRKRKIRDQAVLGQSGLRYLKEQLNVFDDSDSQQVSSVEGHPLPGLSHDANKILDDVVGPALTLYANEVNRGSRGSTKVGERLRKKVL